MRLIVLAAALAVLSGCATTPQGERVERLGLQLLVMNRVIEQAPDRVAKSKEILASIAELRTFLDFEEVSVNDLRAAMLKRIADRDLEPSERLIALELTEEIATFVEGRVGQGVLSPEHKVTVNKVLGYVEAAALVYVSE